MKKIELGGIHAVLYAFFDANEQLDRAAMRRQVELCIEAGADGITSLGLATEAAKLTVYERQQVMDWVAEDVSARVQIGVTVSGQSVAEQIAMVRAAERSGATWVILQPPTIGSYGASEYIDFFSRVMDATDLPTAIQNAPQYLGRGLDADDVSRLLRRNPAMHAIKTEGTAVEVAALIERTGDRLAILNGRGGLELPDVLHAGARGFILAPDALDYAVSAMQTFLAGDALGAADLHAQVAPAVTFVMQSIENLVCYGKRLFAARTGLSVYDRAPALRPTAFGLSCVSRHAVTLGPFRSQTTSASFIGAAHA